MPERKRHFGDRQRESGKTEQSRVEILDSETGVFKDPEHDQVPGRAIAQKPIASTVVGRVDGDREREVGADGDQQDQ